MDMDSIMTKKKKFTPLYLDKQIKMVLKNFTYDEVRSGLESFSFEEWWDVKESLHKKIPSMNLDKLSLYEFQTSNLSSVWCCTRV
jgi:hypothetical protein